MRPLTDHTPKPLIKAAGQPLIQYHIDSLVTAGIKHIVINASWLGQQISDYIDHNQPSEGHIQVVHEASPLETAGGIINVLPLLHTPSSPYFIVINGDVWTDYNYRELIDIADTLPDSTLAHLVMVENPPQHPEGDFHLLENGLLSDESPTNQVASEKLTFSGISLLSARLFDQCKPGKQPLAPLLRQAMKHQQVSGHKASCTWMDIGTPDRLDQLNQHLLSQQPG